MMQRLHSDDFTAFFLRNVPDAELLILPAICSSTEAYEIGIDKFHMFRKGELLDPERLPMGELDKMRRLSGSANFNAQYLQDPSPAELQIVNPGSFTFVDEPSPQELRVITIDTASTKDSGDHSAAIVANLIGSRTELIHGEFARLEAPELARLIKELDRRYEPDLVLIEAIGGGRIISQFLKDQGIQRLEPIPSHGRNSKIERMEAVKPIIDAGKVALLRGATFVSQFLDDIATFPFGASDDYPDALSQLLIHRDRVVQAATWHRRHNPRPEPEPPETFPRYRSRYAEPLWRPPSLR